MRWKPPLAAWLLAAAALAATAAAQEGGMVSPLAGQGTPQLETTDVWISVYLDRLLKVDDRQYRHSGIYMFYLTWQDSTAWETVQNATAAWRAGERACERPCTDWGAVACCDGIYLPSIIFRNAFAFPQDRPLASKIYVMEPPNATVMWWTMVQGEFFQVFDLKYYPFDSFDLGIATEFMDTSAPPHPGVNFSLSGAGTQKYMFGVGDDVSDWEVQDVKLTWKRSNESFIFQLWSSADSAPDDPLPLSGPEASLALTPLVPGGFRTNQRAVQMLFVKVRVSRFWRYHFLNSILPFVVTADQPNSSYVLPTQQQILATYFLLLLLAIESIIVNYIETYKERREAAAQQAAARRRYLQRIAQEAAAEAARSAATNGDLPSSSQASLDVDSVNGAGPGAGGGAQAELKQRRRSLKPKLMRETTLRYMQEDRDYDAWVAARIDFWAFIFLFIGYNLAVILIFVLQSGYLSLLAWE